MAVVTLDASTVVLCALFCVGISIISGIWGITDGHTALRLVLTLSILAAGLSGLVVMEKFGTAASSFVFNITAGAGLLAVLGVIYLIWQNSDNGDAKTIVRLTATAVVVWLTGVIALYILQH